MKRKTIIFAFVLISVSTFAQFSTRFQHEDYYYSEGVRLYHEGHYEAAQNTLSQYTGDTYREQAAFYQVAAQFESRQKSAADEIKAFQKLYPATVFNSELQFMLGTLEIENGKYKRGLKYYELVNPKDLFRAHLNEYLFRKGYAHLQLGETGKASAQFQKLKADQNPYTLQAKYYYAYCQYHLENYGKALPEFLAIEHTAAYKNIVPYYIIQIYYSQGQYDEVYERAEYLLSNAPNNQNNKELHRIIGEVYYREGDYKKAIQHLNEYAEICKKDKEDFVREDCYLLGMSYYHMAQYDKAAEYLANVEAKKDSITGNTLYHLGNAYQQLQQLEQAKMSYSAALHYPQTAAMREETQYNYALTTYQNSSALGESINAFTQFIEEYPNSAHITEIYGLMTDAFMRSKNYTAALEAISKISKPTDEIKTTQQYLRYQLGNDAFLQGKYKEAKVYYNQCIDNASLAPQKAQIYSAESYYWRAECAYKLKQYTEAESDLKTYLSKITKSAPNYQHVLYDLAYAQFAQKKYADAQEYFLEYIKKTDKQSITYADALNRIGDCYYSQKNFVQAENYYAKVIATGASGVDYAMFQRGYCLGLLKRYADKISVMQSLVNTYPRSDYAGDALYEIARAELQRQGREKEAIAAYDQLLSKYPNSRMVRKAALEKGMVYYNLEDYNSAITAYKAVIKNYSGSEEAYSALDGLQQAYIQINKVDDYLAYVKTLGRVNMQISSQEDSLTYMAAENQYSIKNYQAAAAGMAKYIASYCPQGRYCAMAQYYLADSHYQLQQYQNAMEEYIALTQIVGNPYMNEAIVRVAEIAYDLKNYQVSLTYFQKMLQHAATTTEINTARLGILRCANYLNDYDNAINIATEIYDDVSSDAAVVQEAQFYRAKSYIAKSQPHLAINDLKTLSKEVRTARGAEAKYLLAEAYYNLDDDAEAEQVIMDMASQSTTQQYWLARNFILLADIYVLRHDYFQAKQYLLSLQANYPIKDNRDDIQALIQQRLQKLEDREKEQIIPEEDEDL